MSCCGGGLSYGIGGKSYDDIIKNKFEIAKNVLFLIGNDNVSINYNVSINDELTSLSYDLLHCFDFLLHYDCIWSSYPDAGFSYYKRNFLIPSKKVKPTKLHHKVVEIYSKLSSKKNIIIISTDKYGLMKKCFDSKNIPFNGKNLLQVGGTINDFKCLSCRKTCVNPYNVKCQTCKGLLKPVFYPFTEFKVSEDAKYILRHLTPNDLIVVLGMKRGKQMDLLYYAERSTWRIGFKIDNSDVYQSSRFHPRYILKDNNEIIDKLDNMMNSVLNKKTLK